MRPLLDRAADGRSRNPGVWYALAHASLCPGCGKYLTSLREIVERLRSSRDTNPDEAVERLEKWMESES